MNDTAASVITGMWSVNNENFYCLCGFLSSQRLLKKVRFVAR